MADGRSESAGGGAGSHEAAGPGRAAAERPASEQHPQVNLHLHPTARRSSTGGRCRAVGELAEVKRLWFLYLYSPG